MPRENEMVVFLHVEKIGVHHVRLDVDRFACEKGAVQEIFCHPFED